MFCDGGVGFARDGWLWEGGNEWYESEYSTVLHLVVASSRTALTSTSHLKWMKFVKIYSESDLLCLPLGSYKPYGIATSLVYT